MYGFVATAALAVPVSAFGAVQRDAGPPLSIPFELHRNKILIPVTVNGAGPYDFILDTGSPVTVLTAFEDATTLGLELGGRVWIGGAGDGNVPRASRTEPAAIAIGGIDLGRVPLIVVELKDNLAASSGRAYAGIIGKLLFDRFVVRIDFQKRVLLLFEPGGFRAPTDALVLPLRMENGHPHIDAVVRLQDGTTTEADLVVDTGARMALTLDRDPRRRIGPPPDSVRMIVGRGAAGTVTGTLGLISELTLGDARFPDLISVFVEDGLGVTPGADGNLGAEFLRRFHTTVDYPNRRLFLERTSLVGAPIPVDLSGITIRAQGEGWTELVVADVRPSSVAEAAGIRVGDQILAVDGEPPGSLEALEGLMRREGPTRLRVERDQREFDVELDLRAILSRRPDSARPSAYRDRPPW